MEKIINKIISSSVEGCDVYHHKGSTWLIFTDTKQWVIELTEDRTLWYDYNFFNGLFAYVSMDVVENEHYITKWVENNLINGIRGIAWGSVFHKEFIDDVIENGIQEPLRVQDLTEGEVEEVIEFGVKETHNDTYHHKGRINGIIKNGVKETNSWNESIIGDLNQNGCIDNVIDNGIKETNPLPAQDGNRDWGNYYHSKKNRVKPFVNYLDEAIMFGVKKTISRENPSKMVDDIIKKTKTPNKGGDIYLTLEWMHHNNTDVYDVPKMINNVIDNGVKKTKADASQNPMGKVTEVLRDGKISQ
jgi:hypothetical protein